MTILPHWFRLHVGGAVLYVEHQALFLSGGWKKEVLRALLFTIILPLVLVIVCIQLFLDKPGGRASPSHNLKSKGLRVMQFNVQGGQDMRGKEDLANTAHLIVSQNPDVVCMQELYRDSVLRADSNQLRVLSELTGLRHFEFGEATEVEGGGVFGNGILSRFFILETKIHHFSPWAGRMKRSVVAVRVDTGAGDLQAPRDLWFVSVHLQNDLFGLEQEQQAAELVAFCEGLRGECVICGDFNSPAWLGYFRILRAAFLDLWAKYGNGFGRTYPSFYPLFRLDYIFTKKESDVECAISVPRSLASDHLPLVADLSFVST